MRKILPFLVVSILVLSGLGAVAINNEKSEALNTEPPLPAYINFLIKGGFGITAIIKSDYLYENTGYIHIITNGLFGIKEYDIDLPDPIPLGSTMVVKTGLNNLIFGLGPCTIHIFIYLYNDSHPPEGQIMRYGFMFGPFILLLPIFEQI